MPNSDLIRRMISRPFGQLSDGRTVTLYKLTNACGTEIDIIDLGGIIVSLKTPDRDGHLADITLGMDTPDDYLSDELYLGALLGRFSNRIAKGQFSIDGQTYQLPINNGPNALHGGDVGFDKHIWTVKLIEGIDHVGLVLSLISEHGDQGYPGTLHVEVSYVLNDSGVFTIEYSAHTDKPTIINMTQHAYFNLRGHDSGSVLDQEISINSDYFTPIDEVQIPTGERSPVARTAMDFSFPKRIGEDLNKNEQQLNYARGYDHFWVLNRQTDDQLELAATAYDPVSGRLLEIETDQPGLFFYTGNFLGGSPSGKGGSSYKRHSGFTLEPQRFPDSPNQSNFPSPILRPGEVYRQTSTYRFSTK